MDCFDFQSFLESLPQPRLKVLINLAVKEAIRKNPSHKSAGAWLGGGRSIISYRLKGQKRGQKECYKGGGG